MNDFEIFSLSRKFSEKPRCGDHSAWLELTDQRLVAVTVADGVGSLPCDWQASQVACKTTLRVLASSTGRIHERMTQAIIEAHNEIQGFDGGAAGALTTMLFAVWDRVEDVVHCLGIGDSRIYRASAGKLKQLTSDDVASEAIRQAGKVVLHEGAVQRKTGVSNVLGYHRPPTIDIQPQRLAEGETLVLATDGCYTLGGFDTNIIEVADKADLEKAALSLIFRSHEMAGNDDATLLLLRRSGTGRMGDAAYWDSFTAGEDPRARGLHRHVMIDLITEELNQAIRGGEMAPVSPYLDYLESNNLFPRRMDLVQLLDTFADDNANDTRAIFSRILAMARMAT